MEGDRQHGQCTLLSHDDVAAEWADVLTVNSRYGDRVELGQDNDQLGGRVVDLTVCVVTRGGAGQSEDDLGVIELSLQLHTQ